MSAENCFTENEAIALMHRGNAEAFRKLAAHILKYKMSPVEVFILLREAADNAEAQAMVVELRDQL